MLGSQQSDIDEQRLIFSVSMLNATVRTLLQEQVGLVWVSGEVSNFSCPASGHWYFTLKDATAQVRCAMFKGKNQRVNHRLQDGDAITVLAEVGLYEPRGDYQLVIHEVELCGDGALQQAFLKLKNKLEKEGLFDPARKQVLPAFIKCLGVITSPTGAAIRDILHVLKRRYPALPVIIYPSPVQGVEAPAQLIRALAAAQAHGACDVLLLARGGGSLEDLWAFNDEVLARAISACTLPIITGIGHEIDFTIADFVADERCPTPSAAAERVSPDRIELLANLAQLERRLKHGTLAQVQSYRTQLQQLQTRLIHPEARILRLMQQVDNLEQRLRQAWLDQFKLQTKLITLLQERLAALHPKHLLTKQKLALQHVQENLFKAISNTVQHSQQQCQQLMRTLHALSPLATLDRGYAVVHDAKGRVIETIQEVKIGNTFITRLHDGQFISAVTKIKTED